MPSFYQPSNFAYLSCSVLDLDAFERCNKAVNLGVLTAASGSEGLIANMQDHQFTCKLFRFLQLLCEGHNLGACALLALGFSGSPLG